MPRPSPKASPNPASRRDFILDETLVLVGQGGYRGFSFKDLAERCNLTKQGVMHYFPTKDQLLISLLNERDASIQADLLDLLSSGGFERAGNLDEMRAIFRNSLVLVVEHMLRTPDFIRLHVILRAEAIGSDHPAKQYFVERDKGTLAWLAERLTVLSNHPASTARHILAMMLGLQEQWLQEEQGFDLLAEWRHALSVLLPDRPGS